MKEIDDSLRKLPPMGGEGSAMFDQVNSPIVDAAFKYLSDIRKFSEGIPAKNLYKRTSIYNVWKIT